MVHLGIVLQLLATSAVDLLMQFHKSTGNVSSVAIEDRGVASMDLAGMIQDYHLMDINLTAYQKIPGYYISSSPEP